MSNGEPLIRVKVKDLAEAGIERVPRVTGVKNGKPQLEDGRVIEAVNVVWCTGFHPGFSWIDLPAIQDETQQPNHHRGVMDETPGLYFVGLKFLHSVSSEQIHGVGRDAAYIADAIKAQRAENHPGQPAARQEKHLESA